jgi:hypothetical protein
MTNRREYKRLYKKATRAKNKKFIDDYKVARGCSRCSEKRLPCLEFHHLDPNGKKATINYLYKKAYRLATIKEEIEKCEVICRNCHAMEHEYDRNENVHQLQQN